MPEYTDFDISDDDDAYEGPDAYLDGDDNPLELEIDQDDNSTHSEEQPRQGTAIEQILRCKCPAACLSNSSRISFVSVV